MKYRPITKLTNREITEAMTKFFDVNENEIFGIRRVDDCYTPQVNVKIGLNNADAFWTALRDPFDCCPCFGDKKKRSQYYQWCLAKGVCIWLKNNLYLEAENEN